LKTKPLYIKYTFSRLTLNTKLFHHKDQSVVIFGETRNISCQNSKEKLKAVQRERFKYWIMQLVVYLLTTYVKRSYLVQLHLFYKKCSSFFF